MARAPKELLWSDDDGGSAAEDLDPSIRDLVHAFPSDPAAVSASDDD